MKIKYSEEIGIAGMEAEARKHGYTELLSPHPENRTTERQSLDGLYLDKGVLVVAEAKGGGTERGSERP